MGVRLLLIGALLCLGTGVASAQERTYKLEHSFKVGQKRKYSVTAHQQLSAGDLKMDMKGQEVFVEKCESYDKSKRLAVLKIERQSLQLSRKKGEKLEEFDSKKPDSKVPWLDKEAVKLIMGKVILKMKPDGLIMRRKNKLLGADVLRSFLLAIENAPHDFLALPDKAVKVNEQWKRTLSHVDKAPGGTPMTFRTQFKFQLKSVHVENGEQIATITFKTESDGISNGDSEEPEVEGSKGEGQVLFNITKGQMKSLQFTHRMALVNGKKRMKIVYKLKSQLLK